MSAFRVTAVFDLEITDEAAARAIAEQRLIGVVDKTVLEGGRIDIETDAKTPGEAIDKILDASPRVIANLVATEVLAVGSERLHIEVENFKISCVEK